MKALLPLISAISSLVAAGLLLAQGTIGAAVAAVVLIGLAALLMRDHDRQIARAATVDAMEFLNRPVARR